MTLVELLVVLALLVVIGSIVVPVFTGSFATVRLRRAGDQVLTRWSQARARAIETGDVYQFTYTPDSGTYQVGPWSVTVDEAGGSGAAPTRSISPASAAPTASVSTSDTGATTSAIDEAGAGQSITLPGTILFQGGQIAVEDALVGERQVASLQSTGESISTPVLFFPDGTTSHASVVLTNDRNQFVRLTLRGLTGVGRATDVLSREELQGAVRGH
jgi:Tfp pilus assembly protein FimT